MASPLFFDDFRHGIDFRNTWVPGMPWSPIEGDGSYPAEGCFYVNPNHPPTATLSPFSIVGGALQIKVFPTPAWAASVTANKPYIGGLMTSKFQRRYGFYECVAQNPHGPGLSGAFGLYPEVKSNEAEIDVYEHIDGYVMQTVHDGEAVRGFEVEGEAALVTVEVLEVGAVAGAAQAGIAVGGFDLDDIGAPVRELADAGRAGADAREVDDLEAGEGEGVQGGSSSCA